MQTDVSNRRLFLFFGTDWGDGEALFAKLKYKFGLFSSLSV